MFQSATLKLTLWYLGILMAISLIFSIAIYQINFHEVNVRLENLQRGLQSEESISGADDVLTSTLTGTDNPQISATDALRIAQSHEASNQMILSLLYINFGILLAGGVGSYVLARRTLKPIEQAHDAQSRFTSDASHELRTPLAAMKAEIEVTLRDKKIPEHEARELLESNLEEVNKLIQLSEMLLNLSRLDYNRLEMKKVDMSTQLNEALKSFKDSKDRFDITSRKNAFVQGDKTALTELMTILIDNAVKYSEPDSRISIRIYEQMRLVCFEIVNTGPTISEDALPQLFHRFYRGDGSRTQSNANGYGLGLSLAKKIVDVHGGEIEVTSKKNKIKFTFFMPSLRLTRTKLQDGKITTK